MADATKTAAPAAPVAAPVAPVAAAAPVAAVAPVAPAAAPADTAESLLKEAEKHLHHDIKGAGVAERINAFLAKSAPKSAAAPAK